MKSQQVILVNRPQGWVTESDFRLTEIELPALAAGQLLVHNRFLSLDPYMRLRMNDGASYAAPAVLGEAMVGATVGEVVESRSAKYKVGEIVTGSLGWRQYSISDGSMVRRVDPSLAPISTALGILGMPGVTAWVGLLDLGEPKAGETVVVSAASGAVGAVVAQLARIQGCRVIGIAGGAAKCAYVTDELRADACIDYKSGQIGAALDQALAGRGVDVYFDNVGGEILDTVLPHLNAYARVPLCGVISQYNLTEPYGMRNLRALLVNRVRLQGFIVSDHIARWSPALQQLASWLKSGELGYQETITRGLEQAPKAFVGMLRGENFGKQLVALD